MSLVFSNNVVRKIRNHFGPIMDPFTPYHHCKWTATKPNKPTIFSAQDCPLLEQFIKDLKQQLRLRRFLLLNDDDLLWLGGPQDPRPRAPDPSNSAM